MALLVSMLHVMYMKMNSKSDCLYSDIMSTCVLFLSTVYVDIRCSWYGNYFNLYLMSSIHVHVVFYTLLFLIEYLES